MQLIPLDRIDPAAVEHLLDRAFGSDRRQRTAYRLRDGAATIHGLSFAAVDSGRLAGTVQCWPVALDRDDGRLAPLTMLGPVAVEPVRQRLGIGHLLMDAVLAAWQTMPDRAPLMLIGDPEYYGRFFGFTAERTSQWRLPGPFEPRRLLARGDDVPAEAGMLRPRIAAAV